MTDRIDLPPLFLVQEELCALEDGAAALRARGREVVTFHSEGDWRDYLRDVEDWVAPGEGVGPEDRRRVVCFVSRPVARFIESERPHLAEGLFHDAEALRFHSWSEILPDWARLNHSYVILPLGTLPRRVDQLRSLFGERIFLRPDGAEGEFSGLPLHLDDLDVELTSLTSLNHVPRDLLVVVDRARDIGWQAGASG